MWQWISHLSIWNLNFLICKIKTLCPLYLTVLCMSLEINSSCPEPWSKPMYFVLWTKRLSGSHLISATVAEDSPRHARLTLTASHTPSRHWVPLCRPGPHEAQLPGGHTLGAASPPVWGTAADWTHPFWVFQLDNYERHVGNSFQFSLILKKILWPNFNNFKSFG